MYQFLQKKTNEFDLVFSVSAVVCTMKFASVSTHNNSFLSCALFRDKGHRTKIVLILAPVGLRHQKPTIDTKPTFKNV